MSDLARTDKAGELAPVQDYGGGILADRVRELLAYDLDSGKFHWRVSRSRQAKVGSEAGGISHGGRRYIKIDGRLYQAHRLAFLYVQGAFPPDEVDHIDGDPLNNSWWNLRPCSRSENLQNKGVSRRNKSGYLGVSKHGYAFQATIHACGRQIHLGRFATAELAHAAYCRAKALYHNFNPTIRAGGARL